MMNIIAPLCLTMPSWSWPAWGDVELAPLAAGDLLKAEVAGCPAVLLVWLEVFVPAGDVVASCAKDATVRPHAVATASRIVEDVFFIALELRPKLGGRL